MRGLQVVYAVPLHKYCEKHQRKHTTAKRLCSNICRYVPMFGEVDYKPANAYSSVPFEEQMGALSEAVAAGKVRQIGASNETPWGLTKLCQLGRRPFLLYQ